MAKIIKRLFAIHPMIITNQNAKPHLWPKDELLTTIRGYLEGKRWVAFSYMHGSFIEERPFRI